MKRILGYVAALGFTLSFVFHYMSHFGFTIPTFPFFLLHATIFVLIFPIRNDFNQRSFKSKKGFWTANPNAPRWLNRAVQLFGFYALVNFLVAFVMLVTNPPEVNQRLSGAYGLLDVGPPAVYVSLEDNTSYRLQAPVVTLSGVPVRRNTLHNYSIFTEIPESDFTPVPPVILRAFSGHWMVFYLLIYSLYVYPPPKNKRGNYFENEASPFSPKMG